MLVSNQQSSLFIEEPSVIPERFIFATYVTAGTNQWTLDTAYNVSLWRKVDENYSVLLDRQTTNDTWFNWDTEKGQTHNYCRIDESTIDWNVFNPAMPHDILDLEVLQNTERRMPQGCVFNLPIYENPDRFRSIGDLGRLMTIGPTNDPEGTTLREILANAMGPREGDLVTWTIYEERLRLNLQDPIYSGLFNYLTLIDPSDHINNDPDRKEIRIKGRININTAPWFVIARLPWIWQTGQWLNRNIAAEITGYRDYSLDNIPRGFGSIAELMQVPAVATAFMDDRNNLYKRIDAGDPNEPDFTEDQAVDDFEERDLLFSRISNLVTVRSDVFSAYILVRIGPDGPQRRVLAILDRSQADSPDDRVRIVAFQRVPDAR
jgi:hypothetical protein